MLKLNIYDKQGKEIVKTYELYRISWRATRQLFKILQNEDVLDLMFNNNGQEEQSSYFTFMKLLPAIQPIIASTFNCPEEEIDDALPSELFALFTEIITNAMLKASELNDNNGDSKN